MLDGAPLCKSSHYMVALVSEEATREVVGENSLEPELDPMFLKITHQTNLFDPLPCHPLIPFQILIGHALLDIKRTF